MCWSYTVSVAFSTAEVALIAFLLIRSRVSSDPFVRKQWMLLPALVSICLMEAIEAYVWSRPDELVSVQETSQANTTECAKWNQRLTVFVWLFILPLQPLWVIFPCRRVGHPDNWLLLRVPEFLALVFAAGNALVYSISSLPMLESATIVHRTLADSNFKSYLHNESCIFLGDSGYHLHWAFGTADTYLTPNAFTYFLLWLSVVFAQPWRFAAGIFLLAEGIFFVQFLYFRMSWEAGSVWCWSAIFIFVYLALQPYVLPCENGANSNKHMELHQRLLSSQKRDSRAS